LRHAFISLDSLTGLEFGSCYREQVGFAWRTPGNSVFFRLVHEIAPEQVAYPSGGASREGMTISLTKELRVDRICSRAEKNQRHERRRVSQKTCGAKTSLWVGKLDQRARCFSSSEAKSTLWRCFGSSVESKLLAALTIREVAVCAATAVTDRKIRVDNRMPAQIEASK
jgi:hypothetical protein